MVFKLQLGLMTRSKDSQIKGIEDLYLGESGFDLIASRARAYRSYVRERETEVQCPFRIDDL